MDNKSMESFDFKKMFEESCLDINLVRRIKELELISENKTIERTTYTFSIPQKEEDSYFLLFLDPRRRGLQINQEIRNDEGKEINILTTEETVKILKNVFQTYLEEKIFDYNNIFGYSPEEEEIEGIMKYLDKKFESGNNDQILVALYTLSKIYLERSYQPLVLLKSPPKSHVIIHEQVDRLREYSFTKRNLINFLFLIDINFLWKIEVDYTSMHYKFKPPKGLAIKDVNFNFRNEKLALYYNIGKKLYFDENSLHIHIPKEYYDPKPPQEARDNLIKISYGFGTKSPMYTLLSLFWFFVLVPVMFNADLLKIFEYWTLPATIIIALSIYSMERPFLKYYLFSHVTFGFIVGFLIYILRILYLCCSVG